MRRRDLTSYVPPSAVAERTKVTPISGYVGRFLSERAIRRDGEVIYNR
jgi:hypothetical protein